MRVASIAPFRVVPPDTGGKSIIYHASVEYARRLESFVCLGLTTLRDAPPAPAAPFPYVERRAVSSLLIGANRLKLLPKAAYLRSMRLYGGWLAAAAMKSRPRIVEVNLPWLACAVREHLPARVPIVLVMQNVETLWYEEDLSACLLGRLFRKPLENLERAALDCAQHVICLTERDKQQFVARYGVSSGKLTVIPPGYPAAAEAASGNRAAPDRKRAVFVGSGFGSNRAAAEELLRHVAPHCGGEVDIVIAGGVCEALRGRTLPPGVSLAGYVQDLEGLFRECDVLLNPSRMRTGINVKVIEALGTGLRVISTPQGARGYEELLGGPIQVAEIPRFPGLMRRVSRLSEEERGRIQAFRWSRIVDRRLDLYGQLPR